MRVYFRPLYKYVVLILRSIQLANTSLNFLTIIAKKGYLKKSVYFAAVWNLLALLLKGLSGTEDRQ